MAIVSMTRKEAENRVSHIPNGDKYLNILLSLGLLHIQEERMVIDITDNKLVIIKRHGRIIYEE